jgi:outer membrane protein assembly factor BamB
VFHDGHLFAEIIMQDQSFSIFPLTRRCIAAAGVSLCLAAAPVRAEFGDELFKLTASDAAGGDGVGVSVSMNDKWAIVGAHVHGANGFHSGAAYLFDMTTGAQLRKLTASDAQEGDWFGVSVAMNGSFALVGASQTVGSGIGAAYLFDVTTGQELMKLSASDGAAKHGFGGSVAVNGDTAIIGARQNLYTGTGSAYVFDLTSGQELQKLTASDAVVGDEFGHRVDISGNVAIVGAPRAGGSGSAYLFDIRTGQELGKLIASDAAFNDRFGRSVAIDGNIAIVGASGAAYLFDVTTGQELHQFSASDGMPSAGFGYSVDLRGNTAIVGAWVSDHAGMDSGSAYLFDVATGQEVVRLTASDALAGGLFGRSVAINDVTAIVGSAPDASSPFTGWAYLFDVARAPTIPGDFNNDATVDAADYIVWRNGLGTTYTQTDYDAWRANFGQTAAGAAAVADTFANGSSASIPEPVTAAMVPFALLPLVVRRGR